MVLLAFSGAGHAEAPLPDDWHHWRYSAPLEPPADPRGLTAVIVTPEVAAHAQPDLADVRVIDDSGREVPYVLHATHDRHTEEQHAARLLEVGFVPGESTRGIVDLGEDPPEHNALEVEISLPDYFLWVEVAISRDGEAWTMLNPRSPIYRFQQSGLDGNQTIRYSASRARYLRVRLLDGEEMLPLDRVRVSHEIRREAERTPLEAAVRPDPAAPPAESWWLADMGKARQPVSEVRFAADQAEFHRAVRVRVSDDGKAWRTSGYGDIYRIAPEAAATESAGEEGRERLSVRFPEAQARYWRVEVINRNDPEVSGASVQLLGTPRRVVFRAERDRSYRLLIGHPRAIGAHYEMARLTPQADLAAARAASLGPIAVNPAWADPAPWTERNPYLLWIALLLAAAIIVPLALRALRG